MLRSKLMIASSSTGSDPILRPDNPDLVAFYTMDSISGSALIDETGNYDGTIYGATQTTGVIGDALSFNGTSDYVKGDIPTLSQFEISFWVSIDSLVGLKMILESSENFINNAGAFTLNIDPDWTITPVQSMFLGVRKSSGYNIVYAPLSLITTGQYYHFFIKYDSADNTSSQLQIRINNSLESLQVSAYSNYTAQSINADDLFIGSRNGASLFAGMDIDQLRIFNRVLTNSERTALYEEGL